MSAGINKFKTIRPDSSHMHSNCGTLSGVLVMPMPDNPADSLSDQQPCSKCSTNYPLVFKLVLTGHFFGLNLDNVNTVHHSSHFTFAFFFSVFVQNSLS